MSDQPESELGYGAAMAELDKILGELEGRDVDVDELSRQVTRASTLIATCRDRISSARLEVEKVVADLDVDLPQASAQNSTD